MFLYGCAIINGTNSEYSFAMKCNSEALLEYRMCLSLLVSNLNMTMANSKQRKTGAILFFCYY